jgi:HSP20 family protein
MLKRYNPFEAFGFLDGDLNRFFKFEDSHFVPQTDISETEDSVMIEVNCAGYKQEDLSLSIDNGYLTIRGENRIEPKAENVKYHVVERQNKFSRSFKLPTYVNLEDVKADFSDGVLTVVLAKSESHKSKKIEIQSNVKALSAKA